MILQPPNHNILIESQIFPPIQTIAYCIKTNNILFEASENYQKRSFRNRYQIGSHQGILELTIPLSKGKNDHQAITEVKISYDSDWPNIHWKAIQSSYGKSAYFIYYKDLIADVLFSNSNYLFEINLLSWKLIQGILQQDWNIQFTEQYSSQVTDDILDLRSKINLKNIRTLEIPEYYQVFSGTTGFIPQLSILDLIFHFGPEAYLYLRAM